jgi:hypothetical protein
MARGFGEQGIDTEDFVLSSLTTHATLRTWAQRVYITGPGGSSAGRIFDKNETGTNSEALACNTDVLQYQRFYSGTTGVWNYVGLSLHVWHSLVLVYDAGSVANNPALYLDGVLTAPSDSTPPTGTVVTTSDRYVYGNRGADLARNLDGRLADVGIWDRLWSADEALAYHRGFGVWHFPLGRVEALPLIRTTNSLVRLSFNPGGTVVHDHPRVIPPRPVPRGVGTAAVGGGPPTRRNLTLLGVS